MNLQPAARIAALKPYFFVGLGSRIAELAEEGVDVVRLDMGSPDMPPADFIIDALVRRVHEPGVHGYTTFGGTPAYRKAIVEYYGRRFGVELDPKRNVMGLIGSKEGIFSITQAILDRGDLLLVPDPGYGTYFNAAEIAGAEMVRMPVLAENDFLPDLDAIPEDIANRAKMMWLNYPNNPTGAVADLEFFGKAVAFARRHNILIAHDTPYVDVCYGGYVAPSLLQVPGALDCTIEFNSASKAYNMAGWRLGSAVGNERALHFLSLYKNQKDTAHFEPVLYAGIQALTGDQAWIEERNRIYESRMAILMDGLRAMGLEANPPKAALYAWSRVPGGMDEVEFCARVLNETGVSTTPGTVFGKYGAGYFRMSVCIPEDRIRAAMSRMVDWMHKEGYA